MSLIRFARGVEGKWDLGPAPAAVHELRRVRLASARQAEGFAGLGLSRLSTARPGLSLPGLQGGEEC